MFDTSKKDAFKFIVATKCIHEFNMNIYSIEDNPTQQIIASHDAFKADVNIVSGTS